LKKFVIKKGSIIESFESENIHTALKFIRDNSKFPCDLVSEISEKVYDTETNKEIITKKKIVFRVSSAGEFLSKNKQIESGII
jgi:hypothetical protein